MFCDKYFLVPFTFFFWKTFDHNMCSEQVVFYDGQVCLHFDHSLTKGNQVTQVGNSSVQDEISKIRARNYGNYSLKTDGRIDGQISKLEKKK